MLVKELELGYEKKQEDNELIPFNVRKHIF